MKPLRRAVVLVTPRSFDPSLKPELERVVGEVRYNTAGRALKAAELRAAIGGVDGLLAGLDEIDESVFEAAPDLRVVARYGVGTDNVDLRAATRHGVTVTNTPGVNAEAVAELTIGFLFALARSIHRGDRATRSGAWPAMRGIEVGGRTVGLVGLGRIGRRVARRAHALGCRVLAHDPYLGTAPVPDSVHLCSLDELLSQADFVSLHLPLTLDTRGFVDRAFLARMRPGAYLINTARGDLLIESDVIEALESGRLAGVALDALALEPPPAGHPFLQRDDVLITPHIGGLTEESTLAMGRTAVQELLTVLRGEPPRFPVNTISEVGHVRS